MPKIRTLVIASALGAAASYFFDPERGAGRRAQARSQLESLVRQGRRSVQRTAMQIEDRVGGTVAEIQHAHDERDNDDLTILDRVESEVFGRRGFPKDRINADVVDGRLTLRGQLDSEEQIRQVVKAAGKVPGVKEVVVLLHLPGTPAPNKAAVLEAEQG
jgi:osmotically-inducible protein OsmY